MKRFPNKQVISRFHVIAFLFTLIGILILGKAAYIMFMQRDQWKALSERFVKENVVVKPTRGNIFSADGQLLATSLPEYKIYMDYVVVESDSARQVKIQAERDSLLRVKMDSICIGLNRILPAKPVGWYRSRIEEGMAKKSRHWLLYPKRISFIDYKEVKSLPLFNKGVNRSGFHAEEFNEIKKPFGSLASRTIGDLYPGKDSARSGLQLAFDTLLRGKPGLVHKQKVRNCYLPIEDVPPVNGADLVTTIDVKMQDFCEKAIVDKLKEETVNGEVGIVILMEVKTGDVKAIVNMTRCSDGEYREVRNQAVSNLMEPGSVFKPMSFMVAFDDKKIRMNEYVDCCNGIKMMYGRKMKDHNWHRGGYQMLSVSECLEQSSNIGVSVLIDRNYHNHPEQFVNGLYRIGVAEDLHLDIPGYTPPRIRRPNKNRSNWSKTALAWMSIGYESQVPPISVLNFYNGVANNGRMMRPRFVTAAMRNGEVIQEYPPQVVREQMCSPQALKNIQICLERVVSRGLGKGARSKLVKVAGKTGTAQVWNKSGRSGDYLVSFAGYFPAEAPEYSCIVCIQKHGLPASGGAQCGPVFRQIAEMIMSHTLKRDLASLADTLHPHLPTVERGNLRYADNVLKDLNVARATDWSDSEGFVWGRAVTERQDVRLFPSEINKKIVPNVVGMGARDALYLMEKMGLRVRMSGVGIVVQQSLPEGHRLIKGETIRLKLQSESQNKKKEVTAVRPDSLHKILPASAAHKDSANQRAVQPRKTVEKKPVKKDVQAAKAHTNKNN